MQINTKFSIHDEVWLMQDNKAVPAIIEKIAIFCESNYFDKTEVRSEIIYTLKKTGPFNEGNCERKESLLFASKQDLLNSL